MTVIPLHLHTRKRGKKDHCQLLNRQSSENFNSQGEEEVEYFRRKFSKAGEDLLRLAKSTQASDLSFENAEHLLFESMELLQRYIASARQNLDLDFEQIEEGLFCKYLQEFPCFWGLDSNFNIIEIIERYTSDDLTDSQDLAVEAVLELTSDYSFHFTLFDAFEVWNKANREAFLRVLSAHHGSIPN